MDYSESYNKLSVAELDEIISVPAGEVLDNEDEEEN